MPSEHPYLRQTRLPQCGFASDVDFTSLLKANKFLFRVYTPKERSPFADDTDPFFVAPRFDELYNRSPVDIPTVEDAAVQWSYAEVAKHMEWTTRSSSSYISTSFSFSWAIWEAVRRYHMGVKKDIQIAIIDSEPLASRASTAVQLLNTSPATARDEQFRKWYRFSEDSQSVLVYGIIPRTAVLGSVPLLQILRKMPSYFLRKDTQIIEGNPLSLVSWDYTQKKHTYRHFCQGMRKSFASRPVDNRLRDSTAGAVRLGLAFLRPLFHSLVLEDFDRALSYLRTLAITVSEWPGNEWIQDHPEIQQIVDSMVLALGEELREKYSHQKLDEISRLQVVIDGLEETLRAQPNANKRPGLRTRFIIDDVAFDSDGDFELEIFEESEDPTLVNIPAPLDGQCEQQPGKVEHDRPSLALSVSVVPHVPIAFQTPITPPESPSVPNLCSESSETASARISFLPPSWSESSEIPLHPYQVFSPSTERSPGELAPLSTVPTYPPSQAYVFPSDAPLGDDNDKPIEGTSRATIFHLEDASDVEEKPIILQTADLQETCNDMRAKETKPDENEFSTEGGTFMSTGEMMPCSHDEEPHDGQDDDDRTRAGDSDVEELGDHFSYDSPPASISNSWVAVRHRRLSSADRPILSPRSSITSIATLWEPTDLPLKRMSLGGHSESHDAVPVMRSLGVTSRTVSFSFSDFSPPRCQPLPLIADVDPSNIGLPPSPSPSDNETSPPPSVSRSLSPHLTATSRTSSETSSLADSNMWLPLVTPLPPSPALSTSSISRSSSSSSASEWQHVDARSPSPEPTPIDRADEQKPYSIIPPKRAIRLLSPLPASQPHNEDDNDNDADTMTSTPTSTQVRHPSRPSRGSHVGETASYIVTGFLVGAFLTLFLFSTQRRTIIHLT